MPPVTIVVGTGQYYSGSTNAREDSREMHTVVKEETVMVEMIPGVVTVQGQLVMVKVVG